MPLPKIATPTYELELPSTGKTIKYRPFLVKEEKVLILALESQDVKQITLAIKSVLKDCILTKGIKIEDLPSFDIEYIFLNVRGKSVGESIDLVVTCSDDGETEVPVKVFVDEIKVQKDPDHSSEIKLDDQIVIKMKYPSLDQFIKNTLILPLKSQYQQLKSLLILFLRVLSLFLQQKKLGLLQIALKKNLLNSLKV